jgi:hypothetical protein
MRCCQTISCSGAVSAVQQGIRVPDNAREFLSNNSGVFGMDQFERVLANQIFGVIAQKLLDRRTHIANDSIRVMNTDYVKWVLHKRTKVVFASLQRILHLPLTSDSPF